MMKAAAGGSAPVVHRSVPRYATYDQRCRNAHIMKKHALSVLEVVEYEGNFAGLPEPLALTGRVGSAT